MHERPFSSSYDASTATLAVVGAIEAERESGFDTVLAEALADAAHRGRRAMIDLSEVDFFPSAALGVLIVATERVGVDGYELVARSGTIAARVLDLCGLAHR